MDFKQKIDFFKTCENSYTRPLCITDLNMGVDHKIRCFDQFLPQTGDFR
jgi:hypothetical protein